MSLVKDFNKGKLVITANASRCGQDKILDISCHIG